MYALFANNICKKYKKDYVLDNISLSINEGEFLGIVGHNGAGKTTAIRMFSGSLGATAGEIYIFGKPVKNIKEISQIVGAVHQENHIAIKLNVKEYLMAEAKIRNVPVEDVWQVVKMADLETFYDQEISELSMGTRRKVLIAKALIHKPKILFLDEPTASLDPIVRKWIWDYLKRLKELNVTCIIATHYLEEVEYLCDQVLLLNRLNGKKDSMLLDIKNYNNSASTVRINMDGDNQAIVKLSSYVTQNTAFSNEHITYTNDGLSIKANGDHNELLQSLIKYAVGEKLPLTEAYIEKVPFSEAIYNKFIS